MFHRSSCKDGQFMVSSLPSGMIPSDPIEPFLRQFPEMERAIGKIRMKRGYQKKCQDNPKYLHEKLGSIFRRSHLDPLGTSWISHNGLCREARKIFHWLSVEYASETYQRTSRHEELIDPLSAMELFSVHLFTNEGALRAQAKRKAWKIVAARIVRSFLWARYSSPKLSTPYEKKVAMWSDLLPDVGTNLQYEDERFLLKCIGGILKDYPPPIPLPEASLALQRMAFPLSWPQGQKIYMDLAMSLEAFEIAMQWRTQFGLDFSEEQMEQIYKYSFIEADRIDMADSLFSKDLTWTEEKVLATFFSKLHDKPKEEQVVMKAIAGRYERLTIKLLSSLQFSLPFLISALANARETQLFSIVPFLSSMIRGELLSFDCGEDERGLALEAAVKWDQNELLDEILSKKISSQKRGSAVVLATEKNDTELVKKIWDAALIAPEDQNTMLDCAAACGNRELVQLRLNSPFLVSLPVWASALKTAKAHGHGETLKDLFGTWIPELIDDYTGNHKNYNLKSSPK